MPIINCTGCAHVTNTVFVDHDVLEWSTMTVPQCAGRFTGRIRNEVERGCGFASAAGWLQGRVQRLIARAGGNEGATVSVIDYASDSANAHASDNESVNAAAPSAHGQPHSAAPTGPGIAGGRGSA
jgi:hypothetical protein